MMPADVDWEIGQFLGLGPVTVETKASVVDPCHVAVLTAWLGRASPSIRYRRRAALAFMATANVTCATGRVGGAAGVLDQVGRGGNRGRHSDSHLRGLRQWSLRRHNRAPIVTARLRCFNYDWRATIRLG